MKFKIKKSYLTIAVIIIAIGGYYYYNSQNKASKSQVQYVTSAVEKGMLTTSVSASGNVIVDQQATVDPTITGTVADLAVKVGDKVEEGQFLFSIINDDLSVSVSKAVASYEQAKNSLESARLDKDQAKADYDAAEKKDDKDPTAYTSEQLEVLEDKIDLKKSAIVQAEKNLAAAAASYRNEVANANKRKVTAPISGTVNEINIKNGDDLGKNSSSSTKVTPIIIGDLGTLKASVSVNEVDIAKVSLGQKVMLKFDSLDGLTLSGKVEKIDSLGTSSQGVVSYNVTIGFDTLDERIKPQMSVSSSIINEVKQNALIVPTGAVKTDGSSSYVEVLNQEKVPQQVTVQTGVSNNTEIEILSGLKEGEQVVTQTINPSATTSATTSGSGGGTVRIPGLGGGR